MIALNTLFCALVVVCACSNESVPIAPADRSVSLSEVSTTGVPVLELGLSAGARGISNRGFAIVGRFLWDGTELIDLGSLGGGGTIAFDLNDRGQVIGTSRTSTGETHPFLWYNGEMQDLAMRGVPGTVTRINNSGHMIGFTMGPDPRGFFWDGVQATDLGSLGADLNDRDQVVGTTLTTQGQRIGFLWEDGEMIHLGTLPCEGCDLPPSSATAINNRGQIAGSALVSADGDEDHLYLWERGTLTDINPSCLEFPPCASRILPNAINERGQIVGLVEEGGAGPEVGFLWDKGEFISLGRLGTHNLSAYSEAFDINNRGEIAGFSERDEVYGTAVIWYPLPRGKGKD